MKLSLNWVSDFVDLKEIDPQKIADRLTSSVAEVEEISGQGGFLDGCCVGKVLKLSAHPDADRLQLCDVETDRGKVRVVCGGTNLREGMRIAFAHVGTKVKDPKSGGEFELKKVKIRGEDSNGMICAAEELELSMQYPPKPEEGEWPVIDFGSGDKDVGKALSEFIGGGDIVFHIDNHSIAHRPDLFSQVGFAREFVALGLATWKKDRPNFADHKLPSAKLPFKNILDCKDKIPNYHACLMEIDNVGETPDWMKQRLEAVGFRSLYLPIDITNFVMVEVGMPLHSFDAGDFKGDIRTRLSKKGEKITTLDEKERELPEGAIVLSDDDGIFDLLGVMGGLRSSTKDSTKRVYLHSAGVEPASIRKTIMATGHRTDAATIYEKGVPNVIVKQGFNRALQLFLDLVPGAKVISSQDSWGDDGKAKPIKLSAKRASEFLGADIPAKTTAKILKDLEFKVEGSGDSLTVTPPLHRLSDVSGPHDLIEEVGRIFGYDNIESQMPCASIEPPPRDERVHLVRDSLKESGFVEILPLSLVGPALIDKCGMDPGNCIAIENSLGEETSLMQPHSLLGLLEHAENNLLNVESQLCTFHWGQVFDKEGKDQIELGALVASRVESGIDDDPFLKLKSAIKNALKSSGYHMRVETMKNSSSFMHPGRRAQIVVGKDTVGEIFEVHPFVRKNFGLPMRTAGLRINLSVLFDIVPSKKYSKSVPQFPAITYDITIPFSQDKSAGELLKKIKKTSKLLESVEVAKLYSKDKMQDYNLTIRCTYRASDRTLKEEEAKEEHKAVLALVG
ncbi:MAG: phenylalanine--tRNA ligase subunit beta [Candidatus Peribacteraceae bacterium]|jgi:phenylalanyl-tRNA synthetase beta chain|nr:phenylalanine--tRNA ligase subunit beta [Candidatus Peribacteraceae bacterium]MDP7454256.1 phenylalanine--tRNA ligase subunit beta [Candidatus Peribacteraceae bacterium]MDP7645746.1 phenylalanine--tRNA ligase subunit beta [Candidatus Peribacteraceae bacterium]